jgi:hypothetical protein
MPAGFTLVAGNFDLSEYTRVNPGDGLDPYPEGTLEPVFSESPLRDGGKLALINKKVTERRFALFLNEPDPTVLRTLEQDLNRELERAPGIQAEWRPPNSSDSTYWDVEAGVFEPDYNFRRDVRGWLGGMLKLWTGPYGHTATERIVATGAGTGLLLRVAIPSLGGDAPALARYRITAGSQVPTAGRVVALSLLPHPSYLAKIPAGSFTNAMAGASLTGASGAEGSQYLGLPISPSQGIPTPVFDVLLPIGSVYIGANRIFAVGRSRVGIGAALRLFGQDGQPVGPTVVASANADWQLLDLGILRVPTICPTQPLMSLWAGRIGTPSGTPSDVIFPAFGGGSGMLHVNEFLVLPEDTTTVVVDTESQIAHDTFKRNAALADSLDALGNTWATPVATPVGSTWITKDQSDGIAQVDVAVPTIGAGIELRLPTAARDVRMWMSKWGWFLGVLASGGGFGLRKIARRDDSSDEGAKAWVGAKYTATPGALALISFNGVATTLIASNAVPSYYPSAARLHFVTEGGRGWADIRDDGAGGLSLGSVGASHVALGLPGNLGMTAQRNGINPQLDIMEFGAESRQGSYAARDAYVLDGVRGQTYRELSGTSFLRDLGWRQRAPAPQLPPSAAAVAIVVAPAPAGHGNELLAVEVRAQERFRFAR